MIKILCFAVAIQIATAGPPAHYGAPVLAHTSYAVEPQYPPQPYSFGYNVDDGYGSGQNQQETGDAYGNKRGTYGYRDAYGIYRQVDYVADAHGFRATIRTNEPGTDNQDPAGVRIASSAAPGPSAVPIRAAPYAAPAYAAPAYAAPAYAAAPRVSYSAPVLRAAAPILRSPAYPVSRAAYGHY